MASMRLLKSIGAYTVLGFVPLAANFFLLPLYTHYLSPDEYGILSIAALTGTFTTLFISLGIDTAFIRFYFDYYEEPEGLGKLVATTFIFITASLAFQGICMLAIGDFIYEKLWHGSMPFAKFGWAVLVGAYIQVLFSIAFQYYRNSENLTMAIAISLAAFFLQALGSMVGITGFHGGALGAVWGKAIGFLVGTIPFALLILSRFPFSVNWPLLKKMLAYGFPILGYSLLNYTLLNGDRVVAQWLSGNNRKQFGLFSFAATIVSPLDIISTASMQAVMPSIYRMLGKNDQSAGEKINYLTFALVCIQLFCLLLVINFASPLLHLIHADQYVSALIFVPLLGLSQLLRVYYASYNLQIFYSKKTSLLPLINGISIIVGASVAFALKGLPGLVGVLVAVCCWKLAQVVQGAWLYNRIKIVTVNLTHTFAIVGLAFIFAGLLIALSYSSAYTNYVPLFKWVGSLALGAYIVLLLYKNKKEFSKILV